MPRYLATSTTSPGGGWAGIRLPWTQGRACAALAATVLTVACAKNPPASSSPEPAAAPAVQPGAATATPTASGPAQLLRGARVMTATGVILERADVLIQGDRIAGVGQDLQAPADAVVVDVSGMTLTPGIIDTHSHIGVYASPGLRAHSDGNEVVGPNTAYVRARDGFWPQDPQIDTARAGGVTTMQILPGSANLIGGRSMTVKTYPWARSAEDARFVGAPEGLKMACGENPKRVYGEKGGPSTRMGNIAGFRKAFQSAHEYRRQWQKYQSAKAEYDAGGGKRGDDGSGGPPEPPARDFGLETLALVLDGQILVHNHCYRADEMLIMMELAESYGFRIRSFHHAVEAYKIADALAAHGASASVWSDWWGFKAEAYDGVLENAAMVSKAGGRAIIHSDSATGIQHLNQDAAKAMYAGRRAGIDISEDEALRWITLNPAWALGIDDRVGTVEVGKYADLVLWDGSPFSIYSHAQQVFIEGRLVYDRNNPSVQPRTDFETGHRAGDIPVGGAK